MDEEDSYVTEYVDHIDVWFEKSVCQPFLVVIPRKLSPNTITFFNLICKLCSFGLCCSAVLFFEMGPESATNSERAVMSLILSGLLAFVCMTLDYFDGMHARATSQCSTFGMVYDHWVDAFAVPCTTILLQLAVNGGVVGDLLGMLSSAVFGCQLVLWSKNPKHVWVHPPVGGASAQLSVIGFMILCAGMEHAGMSRTGNEMHVLAFAVQASGFWGCIYNCWFLMQRMGEEKKHLVGYFTVQFSLVAAYLLQNSNEPLWLNVHKNSVPRSINCIPWLSPFAFYCLSMAFGLHVNGGMCLYHAAKLPDKKLGPGLGISVVTYAIAILLFSMIGQTHDYVVYLPYVASLHMVLAAIYDIVFKFQ